MSIYSHICASPDSWAELDSTELEEQYFPSSHVDNFDSLIAAYASESKVSEFCAKVIKDIK